MTEYKNKEKILLTVLLPVFIIAGLTVAAMTPTETDQATSPRFKTMDSYHGCDVVRYQDDSNRWHYFLDCTPKN